MDPEEKKAWQEDIDKYKGPVEGYNEGWMGRKRSDVLMRAPFNKVADVVIKAFEGPIDWFHEKVVLANRPNKPEVYYHKKYSRVPTVDTCYVDDYACRYEANEQFKRDRQIDAEIIQILRERLSECFYYHGGWHSDAGFKFCEEMQKDYTQSEINFKIKYGNNTVGATSALRCYLRQRVRMVREELYFMWMREHKDQLEQTNQSKSSPSS